MELYSKFIQGKFVYAPDVSIMLSNIRELMTSDNYKEIFNLFHDKRIPDYDPRQPRWIDNNLTYFYNEINNNIFDSSKKRGDNLVLYRLQYDKELLLRIIKLQKDIVKIKMLNAANSAGTDTDKLKRVYGEIINYTNQNQYLYKPYVIEYEFILEPKYLEQVNEYEALVHGNKYVSDTILIGDAFYAEDMKDLNEEEIKKIKSYRDKLDDIYKKITEENTPEDIINNARKEHILMTVGMSAAEAHAKIFTITEDELGGMGFTPEEVEFFIPKKTIKEQEPQLTPLSSTSSYMTATEDEPFYDASSEYIGGKQRRKKKSNKNKKTKKKSQKRRKTRKH